MNREEKRKHELKAVIELLRWRELDVAQIVQRERPDFEVRLADGARLGIEVTELANELFAQGETTLKRLQIELAHELSTRGITKGIHLGVTQGFATLLASRKVRTGNVKALADLVAEFQFTKGELAVDYDALTARGVKFIVDARLCDTGRVTTSHRATGRQPPSSQAQIDAKNDNVDDYREASPKPTSSGCFSSRA